MKKLFIDKFFFRIYRIYKSWGDVDAYYHSAFVVGVLIASAINCILAVLFAKLNYKVLEFNLFTTGIFLLSIVAGFIFYFHKKKSDFESSDYDFQISTFEKYVINILIALFFATWIVAPIIYKSGMAE